MASWCIRTESTIPTTKSAVPSNSEPTVLAAMIRTRRGSDVNVAIAVRCDHSDVAANRAIIGSRIDSGVTDAPK
ncbi:hypothetical protein BH23ACT6_BH23ACT6_05110 [soil metagenome]